MKRTARSNRVPTHGDSLKSHNEARRKVIDGVEIVCELFGDEASFIYEALALTPEGEIIRCSCSAEHAERQPISAYESVVWMGHAKWAQRFDADSSVFDEATSRWLLIVGRAMQDKSACVVSKRHGSVLVITLTKELSEQWEAASKAARIPLNWMLHDTLKGDAEHYLASGTGYAKDSRELWQATKKKAKAVPIQVVKAGAS